MPADPAMSPGRTPLDDHRLVVASATYDEMEQRRHNELDSTFDSSVATEQADNTHPYLVKYADMYAHDGTDAGSGGPKFIDVRPPAEFKVGQKVLYKGTEVVVAKVVYDDERHPQYTIRLSSGKEKLTKREGLSQQIVEGATDENGEAVGPIQCVDFKVNPTPLFRSLYHGKWQEATERLESHPEEAKVWVARYAKTNNPGDAKGEMRWQLLPLHLCIALGGRGSDESTSEGGEAPDDEKGSKAPPLELLTALLEAYPEATKCTDDQAMTPLHSGMRGNASLAIIKKLLEADPASVYRKDARGRNAFILAEKVYGKRIHTEPVGEEDEARERKYAKLMKLLSEATGRVASPSKSKPRQERDAGPQETKQGEETKKPTTTMQRLQNENLALRRENAELRHRAEIHERLLLQLVDKLQTYEDMRTSDIENWNEIFGSSGELAQRREGILTSISEDDEGDAGGSEEVQTTENEQAEVVKPVGGDGAYHKRLERYRHTTPAGNVSLNIISPDSTADTEGEPALPDPTVLLPKLDSCDTGDADEPSGVEENVEVVLDDDGEVKGDVAATKVVSGSDDASNAKEQGQDIFRPLSVTPIPKTAVASNSSDVAPEDGSAREEMTQTPEHEFVSETEAKAAAQDNTSEASSPESPIAASELETMKETASPKSPVASTVEVFETMASKNTQGVEQKQIDPVSVAQEDSPGRRALLPVLSWEEEDQLQVD